MNTVSRPARPFALVFPLSAALFAAACSTVGPGRTGILWSAAGGTQSRIYGEGRHVVAPWNQMYIYDLRTMSNDETLNVIASNGLQIKLDATIRYHVEAKEVVALQTEIGPDYYHKILEPLLRSDARRVFGRYTPEEIYSTKRDAIEREIREGLQAKMEGKHVGLEAVLIRNVELPEAIRRAIDEKLAAEQEVLEVAQADADRKRAEAGGVADYNKAVSGSLSPMILQFERIQQLGRLADSANAKTIVIGPEVGSKVLFESRSFRPSAPRPPARARSARTSSLSRRNRRASRRPDSSVRRRRPGNGTRSRRRKQERRCRRAKALHFQGLGRQRRVRSNRPGRRERRNACRTG